MQCVRVRATLRKVHAWTLLRIPAIVRVTCGCACTAMFNAGKAAIGAIIAMALLSITALLLIRLILLMFVPVGALTTAAFAGWYNVSFSNATDVLIWKFDATPHNIMLQTNNGTHTHWLWGHDMHMIGMLTCCIPILFIMAGIALKTTCIAACKEVMLFCTAAWRNEQLAQENTRQTLSW